MPNGTCDVDSTSTNDEAACATDQKLHSSGISQEEHAVRPGLLIMIRRNPTKRAHQSAYDIGAHGATVNEDDTGMMFAGLEQLLEQQRYGVNIVGHKHSSLHRRGIEELAIRNSAVESPLLFSGQNGINASDAELPRNS
ncbi:MAG: hypothetical protein ACKVVP_07400 [Chloroflexota bacterium]